MSKPLVIDELWAEIKPLLPTEPPKAPGGRPRLQDCAALSGDLFVLKFSERCMTRGCNTVAKLNEGIIWPTYLALKELPAAKR